MKKYYKINEIAKLYHIQPDSLRYYEKVGENQGYFKQDSDGDIVKAGKNQGDIIWHTVNDFEKGKYEGISFEDDISVLKNKGDRLYTKRKSAKNDADRALITYAYYNFENSDYFLKDSLGLTQEEADKFSIVIKTITPSELKKNSAWIDCSNLIYVNPKTHFGNDLIEFVVLKVLSVTADPVISQIQRFIFFPLQKLFCEGSSIPVRIWASVDKQNVHSLFLLILSAKHFYPFHRLQP